jgi:uncharacterized damage-inducible protein DinB
MAFADSFLPEFDNEMKTTRSLLERVPLDNSMWKPHAKSTDLGSLAAHVTNLVGFALPIAGSNSFDFSDPESAKFVSGTYASTSELLKAFDSNVVAAREAITKLADSDLMTSWELKNGDHVVIAIPRVAALRSFMMNHIIHHRGQLSVYLRLNNVPLPSIYGPTADT